MLKTGVQVRQNWRMNWLGFGKFLERCWITWIMDRPQRYGLHGVWVTSFVAPCYCIVLVFKQHSTLLCRLSQSDIEALDHKGSNCSFMKESGGSL